LACVAIDLRRKAIDILKAMTLPFSAPSAMSLFRMRGAWGDQSAQLYDAVIARGVRPIYQEIIRDLNTRFPLPERARVLDVGCGPGHATFALAQALPGAQVTGVDLSEAAVSLARAAYAHTQNARFQTADAQALPFGDGAFDVVISTASIKHWPDPEQGVREALRVLVPRGRLVLLETDPTANREQALHFVSHFRHVPAFASDLLSWYFRRFVAQQSPDVERIAHWVESSGARVITAESLARFPLSLVVADKPAER
jgi:ubiquinone/menaquinone biosynthesis C-methylase UbiE